MIRFFVLSLLLPGSLAVIYSLNDTDYYRMPALYKLDDFSYCRAEGGTYCAADFGLYGNENKALLNMIHEYSDYRLKHFNHTQIHRGVCVTTTCERFIVKGPNNTVDLNNTLEACLDDAIYRQYRLRAKLENVQYCRKAGEKGSVDGLDIVVAAVAVILILLNVAGSFYDNMLRRQGKKDGNPYLLAFSISRNWSKLIAPSSRGLDPRLDRLKLFNGMRTMTMICVFFSHIVLVMAYAYLENPLYIEKAYEDPLKQIIFNGTLVTQTFFVMSAFLLAYNLEIYAENHRVDWRQWPKGMLLRYLRLTPVYALILGVICTWGRFLGSGPMWPLVVESEVVACRQYWWAHLLYINNYIYGDAHCVPQTWYLAADTQLFAFGLLICVLCRSKRSRIIALCASMVVAIVIVALHTFFQDLDAVVIQSPESYRELYAHDDTFRVVFIRGHTNLSTYILGLTGGFLTYYWQKQKNDLPLYKRHRWIFWVLFPIGVGTILTGGFFYRDAARVSLGVRVLYAAVYKPVFQSMVVGIIIGCIFKVENLYRGIIEWRGFTWTGRVSYSAFLLHTIIQRGYVGILEQPSFVSDYHVFMILGGTLFLGFIMGAALWITVESPLSSVTRALLAPPRRRQEGGEEA